MAQPLHSTHDEGASEAAARVHEVLACAEQFAQDLAEMRPGLWRLGSEDLAGAVTVLGELVRGAEAAMTGVAVEAVERGVVNASRAASTTAWVREQGGVVAPGRAHKVATVAEATLQPGTRSVGDALWGGGISLDLAAWPCARRTRPCPCCRGRTVPRCWATSCSRRPGPGRLPGSC